MGRRILLTKSPATARAIRGETLMSTDETDRLKSLFESVTGETTVTDSQSVEIGEREIVDSAESEAVDTIDHHGFVDVIDDAEPSEDTS